MSVERINDRWAQTYGDDRLNYGRRFLALGNVRRSPWHWLLGCRGRLQSDKRGLWFQCSKCHQVSGFVPRSEVMANLHAGAGL